MILLLAACTQIPIENPVRAVLDDGQVMTGQVQTETLLLEGGMGTLAIPVIDVGEVVPVEGGDLGGSGNYVTVWLRNGSELRGRWADPELTMGIEVGGSTVDVVLPMDQLERFQLQDGQYWPEGAIYRVTTSWGDDFLIDPETTRFEIENELGIFAPFLSECTSVEPLGDGDWRIELATGTVLIGPLTSDEIDFQLSMGPGTIRAPLDTIVGIDREDWGSYEDNLYRYSGQGYSEEPMDSSPAASPGLQGAQSSSPDVWFENAMLRETKRANSTR